MRGGRDTERKSNQINAVILREFGQGIIQVTVVIHQQDIVLSRQFCKRGRTQRPATKNKD